VTAHKIEIYKIKIPKSRFSECPKDERIFYVRAMNFLTDIGINQKHLIFSLQNQETEGLKLSAGHVQATYFMRHLAGLLFEGWQLIRKGFHSKRMGVPYPIEELDELKVYFKNSKNIIEFIRNRFAYHLDKEAIEGELASLEYYSELEIYLNEAQGNCFYQLGDQMLLTAMMKMANKENLHEAFDQMYDDVTSVAKCMQRFFGKYMAEFHRRYLGVNSLDDVEKIELSVPGMSEIKTPFFVSRDI